MVQSPAPEAPQRSVVQALVMLVALIPLVAALIAMAEALGIGEFLFAGFVFIFYWGGIKHLAPAEFVPTLAGALGGLGLAYLARVLPVALGVPGSVIVAVAILLSIYLLLRGQAPILINQAFMLMLTLGSCIAFKADGDYAAAAAAIALTAIYSGGLLLLGKMVAARNTKGTRKAPAV